MARPNIRQELIDRMGIQDRGTWVSFDTAVEWVEEYYTRAYSQGREDEADEQYGSIYEDVLGG